MTSSKEGGAPAVAETSTEDLERAREPSHPGIHKKGTINRRFMILIDIEITVNAIFPIKLFNKRC
jgi:hypothetical protein